MLRDLPRHVRLIPQAVRVFRTWPTFFLDLTERLPKGREFMHELRSGARMLVRTHMGESYNVFESWGIRVYNPPGFEIRENDTVIDVGAHVGSFSIYAGWQGRRVRVFAYEAFAANHERLIENIRLNGLADRVWSHGQAVWSSNETRTFYVSGTAFNEGSLIGQGEGFAVECVALKSIFERQGIETCNLLKMDCEGAEYDILMTAPETLLARIQKVTLEYHDHPVETPATLQAFLEKRGFVVSLARLPYRILYATRRLR